MTRSHRHRPRVVLLACFHETNTFAANVTDRDAFVRRNGWLRGGALIENYAGTRTVLGGMIDGAAAAEFDLVPVFGAFATPAGTVTMEAFAQIRDEMLTGLHDADALDGVLLELHGAMVVEGEPDPEARLLEDLREKLGELPVAVVTDLHANMTARRVALVDILVGYRTNPHVDTYESGYDAAHHLRRLVTGELRTVLRHKRIPVLAPPIAQRTTDLPLLRVLSAARELERRHRLVDVTVHGGYAYADVPHAGMSLTVTARNDGIEAADETLELLAGLAWDSREEFQVELPDAAQAVDRALQLAGRGGGPVAVADTGDNINGGGPGDTTWLVHEAARREQHRVAATIWDPDSVAAATAVGVGGRFAAELGGKAEELGGAPLRGDAEVRWVGQGEFVNTGPMAAGARVNMGAAAVVTVGNLDVVLQSLPMQPNDPELFRSVGLDPSNYALVLLKGAAALRAGWGPIVTAFVDAGTRGVTDGDLHRLPYRHLDPLWPLVECPNAKGWS